MKPLVKVSITTLDGEVLDQIVLATEDESTPVQAERTIIDLLEERFMLFDSVEEAHAADEELRAT